MFRDAAIAQRMEVMLNAIDAPGVPLREILLEASRPEARPHRQKAILRGAIAAAIAVSAIGAMTPLVAPGVVETLQARIARMMLWTPPPPPPKSIGAGTGSRVVNLQAAQSLVHFHIVPPAGLPKDVVSTKIRTIAVTIYSNRMRKWSIGAPGLEFVYRRRDGRGFSLLADDYDPRTGEPPKYIFNADETGPNGLPKRYENFAWRNGDQIVTVLADGNLSALEIEAIRIAMRGTPLPLATTRAELNAGTIVKRYSVP